MKKRSAENGPSRRNVDRRGSRPSASKLAPQSANAFVFSVTPTMRQMPMVEVEDGRDDERVKVGDGDVEPPEPDVPQHEDGLGRVPQHVALHRRHGPLAAEGAAGAAAALQR